MLGDGGEQAPVEAVPSRSRAAVEPVGVPEDGEAASVLGRPLDQPQEVTLRLPRRKVEVPLLEGHVHVREGNLDQVEGAAGLVVPGPERMGEAGAEADRIREAEGGVVPEAGGCNRLEVAGRIDAQVVIALALERARKALQLLFLAGQPGRMLGRRV